MAKKTLFLSLLLVFWSFCIVAQNIHLIDSLREELTSAEGKEKFNLLNDLAWEYRSAYPDSTILYAERAYTLGQELKLAVGLAEPLNFMGVAYNYRGDRLRSYEYYDQALKLSTLQNDSRKRRFPTII